ncbi:MAG: F0F1 ATP synthase subunit B [Patescibacteria group bacterium]
MDIMEILGKIGFDWRMALANLVNFLIIFWLLKRYAFAPIKRTLNKRQEEVGKGLEDAEKARTELVMAKENYEKKMNEARAEAQGIVTKAHEQAESMKQTATEEAEAKVEKIVADARSAIKQERERMERELQAKTVDIALEVAGKILKQKLDPKTESALIKELTK